jgi:hypothetical protein
MLDLYKNILTNPAKLYYKLDIKFTVDNENDIVENTSVTIKRAGNLNALTAEGQKANEKPKKL